MSKPFYVTLPNRGLIHLEGEDRVSFLQGLVSNDVEKVTAGAIQYSCLLAAAAAPPSQSSMFHAARSLARIFREAVKFA